MELERSLGWLPPEVRGVALELSTDGLVATCVRRDGAVSQLQLATDPRQAEIALARWLEGQGLLTANAAAAADRLISRQFDARHRHSAA